ncbi:inorganic phosphate transporter [Schizosaccharomyces japonicus yFS275]|uniref:Inorganic phosphate transporter n=1 Tax=Schizosaccharomyces japonicus (strain yFS275 / FY16936) TaxID=402676 RepID=B6JXA9_SCHJY|nr:inorganic phosphate transporter [Schizosaccharomyces japonicus yFS275]EEB06010.1 inorganic phosphate transporter [Schizosaccharomyces japonicus yFS275]
MSQPYIDNPNHSDLSVAGPVAHEGPVRTLEEVEQEEKKIKGLGVSKRELKVLALAGAGFFLDSYDLFIINLVTPILEFLYWGGIEGHAHYPSGIRGLVNAASNIGNVFGQVLFGFFGDYMGRKFVYGKEMIIVIVATCLCISLPQNHIHSATNKMMWLFVWRFFLGVGIGGDYPMSASITSERSLLNRRGKLLSIVFAHQGFGTLVGAIVTICLLAIFQHVLNVKGEYHKLEGVWRLQIGLSLVPALAVLYPRLTMKEAKSFEESRARNNMTKKGQAQALAEEHKGDVSTSQDGAEFMSSDPAKLEKLDADFETESIDKPQAPSSGFFEYFREWRHLKILISCAVSWFLLDIAFYGINLNQSVILKSIGFTTGKNEYHKLMKNACGNLIIAIAGYVPGYWITVFTVEKIGRKWIQLQGLFVMGLMFAILAGSWGSISTAGRFICFVIAQLFSNFGPNATTFLYPAEVFPARVRGTAHGVSAACGKCGAIIASLCFNIVSDKIGMGNLMWILCGCMWAAIPFAFLLPETMMRDAEAIDRDELLGIAPKRSNRRFAWYWDGI